MLASLDKISAHKAWLAFAGLNGLSAVAMGAVSAHVIVDPHLASLAEKASSYQLIHAAVLLSIYEKEGVFWRCSRFLYAAGLILFCGSLDLKALSVSDALIGAAPYGGTCFMVGWLLLVAAALKSK